MYLFSLNLSLFIYLALSTFFKFLSFCQSHSIYLSRDKIRELTKDHPDKLEAEKFDNIRALATMIKKIKNMEIMSQVISKRTAMIINIKKKEIVSQVISSAEP